MADPGDRAKLILLRQDVEELRREVSTTATGIEAVTQLVEDLAARQAIARPPAIHWPTLDDDAHDEAWPALLAWMRDVLVARHPAAARALRPCWWDHPDAVDALTAAWQTWQVAWSPGGEATARADWLGRWLPQAIGQVGDALASCDVDRHYGPPAGPDVVGGAVLRT